MTKDNIYGFCRISSSDCLKTSAIALYIDYFALNAAKHNEHRILNHILKVQLKNAHQTSTYINTTAVSLFNKALYVMKSSTDVYVI